MLLKKDFFLILVKNLDIIPAKVHENDKIPVGKQIIHFEHIYLIAKQWQNYESGKGNS